MKYSTAFLMSLDIQIEVDTRRSAVSGFPASGLLSRAIDILFDTVYPDCTYMVT